MTLDEVYQRAIDHIGEALPVAESHGVRLNIEPHGPLTTNMELMLKMMREQIALL
jgi:sugar phosphate isomerase/epimerase